MTSISELKSEKGKKARVLANEFRTAANNKNIQANYYDGRGNVPRKFSMQQTS